MYDLVLDKTQQSVVISAREVAVRVGGSRFGDLDAAQRSSIVDSSLYGIGLRDELGGIGLGCAEESLVFEQLGSARVTPGLLAPVLAVHLLAEQSSEISGLTMAGVLAGEISIALAEPLYYDQDGAIDEGWRIVEHADARFAVGVTPTEVVLISLDGATVEDVSGVDRDTELGTVRSAMVVGRGSVELRNRALILISAMAAGSARAVLDQAVEHAKLREQFGKPIASFQAVKHLLADMAVNLDAATAVVYHAAVALDAGHATESTCVTAKATACRSAVDNVRNAIQVFGGMGVTDESDLHRYLRRVHLLDKLFGSTGFQEERLVRLSEAAA